MVSYRGRNLTRTKGEGVNFDKVGVKVDTPGRVLGEDDVDLRFEMGVNTSVVVEKL